MTTPPLTSPLTSTLTPPLTSPVFPPLAPPIAPAAISRGLDQLFQIAGTQTLDIACQRFYFLRHGQTNRNVLRIFQAPDEPLSLLGIEQAHTAAGLLGRELITTVVYSDMQRTLQTAGIVAASHALPQIEHAGLRERNFGKLIGTSSADIDWACNPAAGESLDAFVTRTRLGLGFALTHPAPVLVVAHGGTLYVLVALLKLSLDIQLLGNAQPLLFQRQDAGWTVTLLGGHAPVAGTHVVPNIA